MCVQGALRMNRSSLCQLPLHSAKRRSQQTLVQRWAQPLWRMR